MFLSKKFAKVLRGGGGHKGFLKHPSELQKHISYECHFKQSNKVRQKSNQATMFDIRKCVNSSDVFYFFLATGYLSCCRFTDDNQILTSSGDMTWYDGIATIIITM